MQNLLIHKHCNICVGTGTLKPINQSKHLPVISMTGEQSYSCMERLQSFKHADEFKLHMRDKAIK